MKKSELRSLDTNHIPVQRLTGLLETFALKHSAKLLPDILERAEQAEESYREFLLDLLQTEVKGRNERRRKRNYAAAHFPPNPKSLEEFIPEELESGITESQIRQMRELNWLDTCGNIVLAGPPGLGKTMIAVGLGLDAINSGYTVCFEKMGNLIRIMDTADTERAAGFRLKNLKKAHRIYPDITSPGEPLLHLHQRHLRDHIHHLHHQQGDHGVGRDDGRPGSHHCHAGSDPASREVLFSSWTVLSP